jgi:hypothetical protein
MRKRTSIARTAVLALNFAAAPAHGVRSAVHIELFVAKVTAWDIDLAEG